MINRSSEPETIGEDVPQAIIDYVKTRWENEYKAAEAKLIKMERKANVKDWMAKANELSMLVQEIRDSANRMMQ